MNVQWGSVIVEWPFRLFKVKYTKDRLSKFVFYNSTGAMGISIGIG